MPTVTLKGNPVNLVGEAVSVGQKAPDFKVQGLDLSDYTLSTDAGKTRIYCAVPSLYTGVCDMEMRRFNQEASKLPDTEGVQGAVLRNVRRSRPLADLPTHLRKVAAG